MDCRSWSLACNGLPPFLPGLAPNAGGPDDGGGGGGGPERVAGGGGGGGGGNGIAVCTRAGKQTKNKQSQVSRTGPLRRSDHRSPLGPTERRRGVTRSGRACIVLATRRGPPSMTKRRV